MAKLPHGRKEEKKVLKEEMTTLRLLFEPWKTAPHGPVIWEPEISDPNILFKNDLIARAQDIISAGDKALAGVSLETGRNWGQ